MFVEPFHDKAAFHREIQHFAEERLFHDELKDAERRARRADAEVALLLPVIYDLAACIPRDRLQMVGHGHAQFAAHGEYVNVRDVVTFLLAQRDPR